MITRDVTPSAVADLALTPPRTTLATIADGKIRLLPVSSRLEDPADPGCSPRVVRVPADAPDLRDRNVVVISDDGPQWFRLRSLSVRGTATAISDQTYRVKPKRVVAWDYGSLRYVPTPHQTGAAREPVFTDADYADIRPLASPSLSEALSACRVMILATRSSKGTPFAVPLWFATYGGRIWTTTAAASWTVRNVAACPDVEILFGGESRGDTDRLLVRGHARSIPGMPPAAVLAGIAWRYYLEPRFATVELGHITQWARRLQYYSQSRPAYVVITPQSSAKTTAPQ